MSHVFVSGKQWRFDHTSPFFLKGQRRPSDTSCPWTLQMYVPNGLSRQTTDRHTDYASEKFVLIGAAKRDSA